MSTRPFLPPVPAAFFGIVLGLTGLGASWRAAHDAWGLPSAVGEALMAAGAAVWAVVLLLYVAKWINHRPAALAEVDHPVQCCFIGLAGVATMLVAGGALPHSRPLALTLYALGAAFTLLFAVWRTGGLWQGGRDPATTTAVLYLPTVAGSFVAGIVAAALGYREVGQMAFGAGFFGWLAIESVLLHRLLTAPALAPALRPTLGVQLAPPVVGAAALISVAPDLPAFFPRMLVGYGLLQALVLLRLLPWILKEPFTPSLWAFTFGATALATTPVRMVARGDTGVLAQLAPALFLLANVVVGVVAVGTVYRTLQGQLLPPPPVPATPR
ncbi:dicarboxylate transporter/tellurite-resistance protein TehA [Nitrospirillum viridazoti]|uniref:Tellurite resistance protein n=1 Tax=Nitrospirillum amazonense TaxID=28077 RepID=A0A560I752_9PROT|nr:dicarboxylate transporter/tellurite-resistance protein TehA [Nitrospirillum amazonense]TWB52870.1 tellurite resistance protein [Nitrospirillum amazonense]